MKKCYGVVLIVSILSLKGVTGVLGFELGEVIELEAQEVTASPFAIKKEDLVVPSSRLSRADLDRSTQSSIGATLEGQPGIHSTYFGPGAGRPVIRGFDGDRVRILNNGTDSFDVSETSPDHGVSIEPLFAEAIEVVRGPASLLYGSSAIGGVVNVIGREMPRERSLYPFYGEFRADYGSVSDSYSSGLRLQGGENDFAWSIGYLKRKTDDYDIPGFAESVFQMEAEEAENEGHGEEEEVFGVLENSFVETETGSVGLTWFSEKGLVGFSVSRYNTEYGVPGHSHGEGHDHGHDEGEEDEPDEEVDVTIDLNQVRLSGRAMLLEPSNLFESVELQIGYGRYDHVELEGAAIGTRFERDGYEVRMTGIHNPIGDLTGALGLHLQGSSFLAQGEEAFVPSSSSSKLALFLVERLNTEWGAWEIGGRAESIGIDLDDAGLGKRRFTTANASAGFFRRLAEGFIIAANFSYAERAPNASELFAFGPHAGTRSFEIGDAFLGKENSLNLDLSLRRSVGRITGEFTVFSSDFNDYVYLQFLDHTEVEDMYGELDTSELNVYRATATDAEFYGFEFELRFNIVDETEKQVHFDFLVDQTRATNKSFNTNLPRIPTRRVGGRWERDAGAWLVGVEGRYHVSASHLASDELPTDSYFVWGADARYRIQTSDTRTVDLYFVGRNLGNEEARPHTSFLKDLVPMPGRSIELGIRTQF